MPNADAIYVMWHDPTSYEHTKHGPPYLPDPGERPQKMRSASSSPDNLASVLYHLQWEAHAFQAYHWRAKGTTSYGDHLLFQRLYEEVTPLIDQMGERLMGRGSVEAISPDESARHCCAMLESIESDTRDDFAKAHSLVTSFTKLIARVLGQETLSPGEENLLEGFADKHEEFEYLLKQRAQDQGMIIWDLVP